MKIKDLDPSASLAGVRFIYPPDGKSYYWHSQWQGSAAGGVFGKLSMTEDRVHPLFVKDLLETLEWDIAQ